MLENLDQIDWAKLKHAHGEASDIPDYLRDLLSDDADIRQEALEELWSSLIHQGTVYEATRYAVPFLLELIQDSEFPMRNWLLLTLASMAEGYSTEYNLREGAYLATETGIPVYLTCLEDDAPDVRISAAYVLGKCARKAEEILPHLHTRLAVETEAVVQANLLETIPKLSPPTDALSVLEDWLYRPESHPLVRTVAAMTLLPFSEGDSREEATVVLLTALQDTETLDPLWNQLPERGGTGIAYYVGKALQSLPPSSTRSVIPAVLNFLKNRKSNNNAEWVLITTALQQSGIPPGTDHPVALTALQRDILTQLVRLPLWRWDNLVSTLRPFGLPGQRAEMAQLLNLPQSEIFRYLQETEDEGSA
jgi:hypothetical protein